MNRLCKAEECAKYVAYIKNRKIIVKITKKSDEDASSQIPVYVETLSEKFPVVGHFKYNQFPFTNFLSPNSFEGEYNSAKIKGRALNFFGIHRLYTKIEGEVNNEQDVTALEDIVGPIHNLPAKRKEKKGIGLQDIQELIPFYNVFRALSGKKGFSKVVLTTGYSIAAINMLYKLVAK